MFVLMSAAAEAGSGSGPCGGKRLMNIMEM